MKNILITTIAILLFSGCSDPEAEANKLFTEASKLIKAADDIKQQKVEDAFNAYQKRKKAVELIDEITAKYPQSSLSVNISQGGFKLQQRPIEEIKKSQIKNLNKIYEYGLMRGEVEVVTKCLELGANLNAVENSVPLNIAVDNGHTDIVKLLISNGADPKTKELLNVAVSNGHTDIVKLLISNGADPKTRRILDIAVSKGHMDIFKLLLNNTDAAEILSKKNIDARITEQNSIVSILHHENIIRDKDMLKSLIEKGFDVNAKDLDGTSPLHKAAYKGFIEVVDLLISQGANIYAKDNIGSTPLHDAAQGGQKIICAFLITQGADINAKDRNGSTPLDNAEILLEWNSEERKFEETTTTILEAQRQTAEFLREKGGKTGEELKAEGK